MSSFWRTASLVGYARVSTCDQSPARQIKALRQARFERVFIEKTSGAQRDRPKLNAALDYLRAGVTLAVWKLDRLARSVRQLVETAENLAKREISPACAPTRSAIPVGAGDSCSTSSRLSPRSSAS